MVGRAIVEALRAEGVEYAFCVPGESYLPVMDAFNDVGDVELVATRHEEGAGFMADAWAKATGRPGVAMVTRGPGVTHAAIALHGARQDSTPLVLLAGDVETADAGRESFQEVDIVGLGRLLGKGGVRISSGERAGEQIQRALHLAQEGRPGPVVVALPEDLGYATAERPPAPPGPIAAPSPPAAALEAAARLLESARSVAIIAGGRAGWTPLVELAETLGAPVYAAWRRFDAFPNDHPQFAGNLPWLSAELSEPLRGADVLLVIGARLDDFTSLGYALPGDGQRLVHVDAFAETMGVARPVDVGVVGDCAFAAAALRDRLQRVNGDRRERALAAGRRYARSCVPPAQASGAAVDLPGAIATLARLLPAQAAIVSDAGAFSGYLNRHYRWRAPRTFFGTTAGAMGYAVPGAIGAKLADRSRPVVGVAGDGGFAMTMSEVATASRLGLSGLVYVVFDNGVYGTIVKHQQRRFPGREIATTLGAVDFVGVARGLGATAVRAETDAEFEAALADALRADGPAVVHALTSPRQLDAWADA